MKSLKIADKIYVLLLSLLILVYSSVLQFSMPSVVLCFGDDGHIAFEQSEYEYLCMDSNEHSDHLASSHEHFSHQDEGCKDIPLINLCSPPFVEKESKLKNFKLTKFDNHINTIYTNSFPHFNILIDSAANHTALEGLQTTILLI